MQTGRGPKEKVLTTTVRDGLTACLPNNLRQISEIFTDGEKREEWTCLLLIRVIRAIRG
jgi:hypothetical protein